MNAESVAIMQPYIFPYLGYFHLIHSCNVFVFYDDVNFIKKGWVTRNRILLNEKDFTFTIPVQKASQNKFIKHIIPLPQTKTTITRLQHAYSKAPYFKDVEPLLQEVFLKDYSCISSMCIHSIVSVFKYLNLNINWTTSSLLSPESCGQEKSMRLIHITKKLNCTTYNNLSGGRSLYTKECFKKNSIDLKFVDSTFQEYKQFNNTFVDRLSIIDILMFNNKDNIIKHFNTYALN